MTSVAVTYDLAHAAAWDAGNTSAKRAGRAQWNDDDWNVAAATLNSLLGQPVGVEPAATAHNTER